MKEWNIQKSGQLKPDHRIGPACRIRLGFASLLILYCGFTLFAASDQPADPLSPQQRQWLSEHQSLRIGLTSIPPQVFRDDRGELTGLCIDYITAVEKRLHYQFARVYFNTWKEMMQAANSGQIDVIYAAQKTPEREEKFLFTQPYLEFENMIVTSNEEHGQIKLNDLVGKKVAVVQGNSIQEDLGRQFPGIQIVPADDELRGLLLVSFKEADAMVIEPSRASYIIEDKKITNLRVAGRSGMYFRLGFAVRNDMPQLHEILDAGLAAIPVKEKTAIQNEWISFTSPVDLRLLWWLLWGSGTVALLAIVWSILLRKQVERRTIELRQELQRRTDAEHYRQQVEEQFRHVIEFCPLGVLLYRLENGGRLVLTAGNGAAEKILSMELRPYIGRTIEEIFPALVHSDIPERYRKICKTGVPWETHLFDYPDEHAQGKHEIYAFQTSAGQIAVMFSDISERIAAQRSLAESQRMLATLIGNLPGIAYRCRNTLNWPVEFISKGCKELTGYDDSDYYKDTALWQSLIHPDDRQMIWNQTRDALAQRKNYQLEYRIRTADGQEKWVWEQGCGILDPSGNVVALEGFITDISLRKQIKQELQFFQFAMEHTGEAAYWTDQNACFIYVNEAACRQLGYSREELLTMSVYDIDPTLQKEQWLQLWKDFQQKSFIPIETYHRTRDGREIPVEVSVNYIEFDGKEYNCAIVRDISQRKRYERELQLFQFAAEHSSDLVYWTDPDGRLIYVNEVACKESGYTREELLTMGVPDIDPAVPMERWPDVWKELKEKGTTYFETFHKSKDGRIYPIEVTSNYLCFDGKEYNCAIVRNISQRKRYEQELRFFQFAVEHSGEAFIWTNADAKFFYVNDAACRQLGYSRQELLTMSVADIDPQFPVKRWPEHWKEMKEKGSLRFETCHKSKDGQMVPVEVTTNYRQFDGKEYNCAVIRDISQRKRYEQELKFFQFAVEHSGEAAYWMDPNARFIYVNEAACRQLGYSREELLTMNLTDIDPEYPMELWYDHWKILKEKGIRRLETFHKTKDGVVFPIEVTANFMCYDGKEYNCAIVRDIREQKKYQEQLLLNTERTEALLKLNQMTDASLDQFSDFALEEAVRLTKSKIGYLAFLNEEESIMTVRAWSKSVMEACNMADKKHLFEVGCTGLLGQSIRERKTIIVNDYNAPNSTKKGYPQGHVPVTRYMNIPVIVHSKVVMVAAVANKEENYTETDIQQMTLLIEGMWRLVERMSAEQELANSEKRFREMFQQMSSAVAVYQAVDNGQDFIFTDFNPAAERTEKIKKEELLGRKLTEVFPGVREFGILDIFRQVWKTGQPVHYPLKLYKDSRIVGWRSNYIYRLPGGEIIALYDDVTDRIMAEHAREKLMKELQAKNEELESIVFVASHDLRSPLVNIQGFAGELQKSCRELTVLLGRENLSDGSVKVVRRILDEDIPESLNFISAGTNKMDALAKGLLRLARIGTIQIHIDVVDMNRLMATILKTVQYQMREYEVDIHVTDLPLCLGDWVQLNHVFSNLIDNAIKFRHPNRKAVIEINGQLHDNRVRYTVRDNGIGIAPEHTKKIFEVFHRLNPIGPVKGEGLGLTIVQRILDRLDGKVDVESQPDIGTAFIVELPASV